MPLANSTYSYGSIAKTFHWLTALLIFAIIPIGIIANNMAEAIKDASVATTDADVARTAFLFSLHKTLGITVFFVALLRICWALANPKPGLLNADNRPEALAAETVHWLLYGSLVVVPLSGWIHHASTAGFAPIWWPFGQGLPLVPQSETIATFSAGLHWILQWVLVGAILLHVAGALKHHIVDRDDTLRRMLPGPSDAPQPPAQHHDMLPIFAAIFVWIAALGGGAMIGVFGAHGPADEHGQNAQLEQVDSDWSVTSGTLSLTVTQFGSPVSGQFADWTAAITFDDPPEPGPAGETNVTVSIGSLSLGSVTDQALAADYFDATNFATARFAAELFRTETGYEARGPLTIKDKSVDIVLPFELTLSGNQAEMTGSVRLNRMEFGIGISQPDESNLGFEVEISVALTAEQAQ